MTEDGSLPLEAIPNPYGDDGSWVLTAPFACINGLTARVTVAKLYPPDEETVVMTDGAIHPESHIEWARRLASSSTLHDELVEALRDLVALNRRKGSPLGDYGHVETAVSLLNRIDQERTGTE